MYNEATLWKRILVIIIDYGLIYLLTYMIYLPLVLGRILKLEIPEELLSFLETNPTQNELVDFFNQNQEIMFEYLRNFLQFAGIVLLILFLVYILYVIIMPSIWKNGQTIGRKILNIKVVRTDDSEATTSTYILREVVGGIVIGLLNCLCGISFIVNLVLLLTRGKVINDYIADTKFVDKNIVENDYYDPNYDDGENHDDENPYLDNYYGSNQSNQYNPYKKQDDEQ